MATTSERTSEESIRREDLGQNGDAKDVEGEWVSLPPPMDFGDRRKLPQRGPAANTIISISAVINMFVPTISILFLNPCVLVNS